ncbi:MAG TPA: uroporphyrinogen-III C-methyltransferase [Acidobacteriaceae bacterium]|nr:uroporphyrinogen-III C-methyltransferase [Acidobacteriaceae bacterium]
MKAEAEEHSRWSKAALVVSSDVLTPEEIGTHLGLAPSRTHRKGEVRSQRVPIPWKDHFWSLQSPLSENADMAEHVQWLLNVLDQKLDVLRELSRNCKTALSLGFSSTHGQGGFTLDPQTLVQLARLDVPFSLDLYPPDAFWGSGPEDEPPRESAAAQPGSAYLAGAGPGDPGLLTLRTLRLLQTADVILPDDLVSDEILALATSAVRQHPPQIIPVGKRCGQPRITQAGIHDLMRQHAGAGRSVVRLKSGDPLVFGRAGEEIDALTEAQIPFEIVPGITAAFAVAAELRTPLTDRTSASKLIFATAHHAKDKLELTPKWQGAFPPDATLVVYMPGRRFRQLADELIDSGVPSETTCVAVSRASTPEEHIHRTTLRRIEDEAIGPAPVVLLIGQAIR